MKSNLFRMFQFGCVGGLGALFNLLVLYVMVHLLHGGVTISGLVSALLNMALNFVLNDRFTWSDAEKRKLHYRASQYFVLSIAGLIIYMGVLGGLTSYLHIEYLVASSVGMVCSAVWNYTVNNLWTWRKKHQHHCSGE